MDLKQNALDLREGYEGISAKLGGIRDSCPDIYCLILPDHVFSSFCHHHVKAKQACPTSIFMSLPEEPRARYPVGFHASPLDSVCQF